jgi:hypothetical protein
MEIPETFDYIKDEDVPQMVKWAMDEANPGYPVPKIFGAAEPAGVVRIIMMKETGYEDK